MWSGTSRASASETWSAGSARSERRTSRTRWVIVATYSSVSSVISTAPATLGAATRLTTTTRTRPTSTRRWPTVSPVAEDMPGSAAST